MNTTEELLRISQRASTSCSECSRRKTRCDKQVPCEPCRKRGKAELCRRVPHVRPKDAEKLRQIVSEVPCPELPRAPDPAGPTGFPSHEAVSTGAYEPRFSSSPAAAHPGGSAPTSDLDAAALGALTEVAQMRTAVAGLQDRIQGLEGLLSQLLQRIKSEVPSPPPPARDPTPLPPVEAWLAGVTNDIPVTESPPVRHPALQPTGFVVPFSSPPEPDPSNALSPSNSLALPPLHRLPETPFHQARHTNHKLGIASLLEDPGAFQHQKECRDPKWAKLREEEVAASLSLEFLALGRNGAEQVPSHGTNVPQGANLFDTSALALNPLAIFPTADSLAGILPPFSDCQKILEHALDWTGWLHGSIHAPSFRTEVQEFWKQPDELRLEGANPAWLALLFAQLCCGLRHSTREQLDRLGPHGLTDNDVQILSKAHFDAAVACLYRSHPLENRQLWAVQAIAVLVIACQDGATSSVFPSLLSLGIAMAHDLGLHRLPSDEAWLASVAGQTTPERAQSLILRETKKRVFWALTSEDWFSIHARRMSTVQPTQVTTPLPCNAHDEDLLSGSPVDRAPAEYTSTSKLLIWIQIARTLQQAFQHLDDHPQPSYSFILELDGRMRALLDRMPEWLTSPHGSTPAGLPPNAAWVRKAFVISSNHKTLVLHRAFFLQFETSRRRAIEASRRILREAAHCGDTRMWTVPYHISAAAAVVCLDLFQRASSTETLAQERSEVQTALTTLKQMSTFSAIARRGASLIENLLEEESKLPPCADSDAEAGRPAKRRRRTGGEGPTLAAAPVLSGPSPMASRSPGFLPTVLVSPPSNHSSGQDLPAAASLPSLSDSSLMTSPPHRPSKGSTSTLTDPLPAEFVNVFLENGFDPLDGAITSAQQQDASWLPMLFPSPSPS